MAEPRQPDPLPSQTDTAAESASASASAAALDSVAANAHTATSTTTEPGPGPASSLTSAVSNLSLVTNPTTPTLAATKKPIKIDAADVAFLVSTPPIKHHNFWPSPFPPTSGSTHTDTHTPFPERPQSIRAADAQR